MAKMLRNLIFIYNFVTMLIYINWSEEEMSGYKLKLDENKVIINLVFCVAAITVGIGFAFSGLSEGAGNNYGLFIGVFVLALLFLKVGEFCV